MDYRFLINHSEHSMTLDLFAHRGPQVQTISNQFTSEFVLTSLRQTANNCKIGLAVKSTGKSKCE